MNIQICLLTGSWANEAMSCIILVEHMYKVHLVISLLFCMMHLSRPIYIGLFFPANLWGIITDITQVFEVQKIECVSNSVSPSTTDYEQAFLKNVLISVVPSSRWYGQMRLSIYKVNFLYAPKTTAHLKPIVSIIWTTSVSGTETNLSNNKLKGQCQHRNTSLFTFCKHRKWTFIQKISGTELYQSLY